MQEEGNIWLFSSPATNLAIHAAGRIAGAPFTSPVVSATFIVSLARRTDPVRFFFCCWFGCRFSVVVIFTRLAVVMASIGVQPARMGIRECYEGNSRENEREHFHMQVIIP